MAGEARSRTIADRSISFLVCNVHTLIARYTLRCVTKCDHEYLYYRREGRAVTLHRVSSVKLCHPKTRLTASPIAQLPTSKSQQANRPSTREPVHSAPTLPLTRLPRRDWYAMRPPTPPHRFSQRASARSVVRGWPVRGLSSSKLSWRRRPLQTRLRPRAPSRACGAHARAWGSARTDDGMWRVCGC